MKFGIQAVPTLDYVYIPKPVIKLETGEDGQDEGQEGEGRVKYDIFYVHD